MERARLGLGLAERLQRFLRRRVRATKTEQLFRTSSSLPQVSRQTHFGRTLADQHKQRRGTDASRKRLGLGLADRLQRFLRRKVRAAKTEQLFRRGYPLEFPTGDWRSLERISWTHDRVCASKVVE